MSAPTFDAAVWRSVNDIQFRLENNPNWFVQGLSATDAKIWAKYHIEKGNHDVLQEFSKTKADDFTSFHIWLQSTALKLERKEELEPESLAFLVGYLKGDIQAPKAQSKGRPRNHNWQYLTYQTVNARIDDGLSPTEAYKAVAQAIETLDLEGGTTAM